MTRSIAFIAACVVMMSAANVFANDILCASCVTRPTSLNIGDEYRLAFVTFGDLNGMSSSIATYNTFVNNAGNHVTPLALLDTTWTAIASTSIVDARDNTGTNPGVDGVGVPIFLLNDTKLVDSNNDLWDGTILLFFDRTEINTAIPVRNVLTGTSFDGTGAGANTLGGPGSVVQVGITNSVAVDWIDVGSGVLPNGQRPFYALSDVLVVPEPGTFLLFGSGVVVLGIAGRKRLGKM